ncbi:hypothetical protein Y1Q_0008395 [Alligator mississippiensis]|uniref:Uncharacterized protein n=1 Tax=Alligator mississippiensis TaxID=8496 RepID=A0A151P415_ALLMI|nr:hypothetical protein Y1Q_0008395 [Alligator mississippiensis]
MQPGCLELSRAAPFPSWESRADSPYCTAHGVNLRRQVVYRILGHIIKQHDAARTPAKLRFTNTHTPQVASVPEICSFGPPR